jgi:hypothetical protein
MEFSDQIQKNYIEEFSENFLFGHLKVLFIWLLLLVNYFDVNIMLHISFPKALKINGNWILFISSIMHFVRCTVSIFQKLFDKLYRDSMD